MNMIIIFSRIQKRRKKTEYGLVLAVPADSTYETLNKDVLIYMNVLTLV